MDLSKLSISELETLLAARKILEQPSEAKVPEVEAPPKASRKRKEPATKAIEPEKERDWSKVIKTCPKCGTAGPVDAKFGVKLVRGVVRAQSWCSNCRATTQYAKKPRTYHSKNNR